ncbi:MAG: YesN/AraC family two-component response regulator [Cyclobacteriaceae bacterium]|jgi:YesN/AraC family two-component response regulator
MERDRPRRPKKEFSILYVDDEVVNLRGFKSTFRRFFNVYVAENPLDAMDIVKENNLHIVVSDHRMPEMVGTDLLKAVYNYDPEIRRMILSGFITRSELKVAVDSFGIHEFINKPWDFEQLMDIFKRMLEPNPPLLKFN